MFKQEASQMETGRRTSRLLTSLPECSVSGLNGKLPRPANGNSYNADLYTEVAKALALFHAMLANEKDINDQFILGWTTVLHSEGVEASEVEGIATRLLKTEKFFPTPSEFLKARAGMVEAHIEEPARLDGFVQSDLWHAVRDGVMRQDRALLERGISRFRQLCGELPRVRVEREIAQAFAAVVSHVEEFVRPRSEADADLIRRFVASVTPRALP